jgi:HeH/LEM domain
MESLAYLEPGYDLSGLTIPRLRQTLVYHDIPYPSYAKKPELVRLVQEKILPKRDDIKKELQDVQRSEVGITNA